MKTLSFLQIYRAQALLNDIVVLKNIQVPPTGVPTQKVLNTGIPCTLSVGVPFHLLTYDVKVSHMFSDVVNTLHHISALSLSTHYLTILVGGTHDIYLSVICKYVKVDA